MSETTIQFLGQAGYKISSGGVSVVIDPYLTDSCGGGSGLFKRSYPPVLAPEELHADVMILTHNHGDHLDAETIRPYRHKETTRFIAPRLTAPALLKLGVPERNITVVDHAGALELPGVKITGVFALGTSPDSVDTCGYLLAFPNGKTIDLFQNPAWRASVLASRTMMPGLCAGWPRVFC